MITVAPDSIVAAPARQSRVTLRKTVISCALLAGALLLAIVFMSLIGSEQLPARASLCALASLGTTPCGFGSAQHACSAGAQYQCVIFHL